MRTRLSAQPLYLWPTRGTVCSQVRKQMAERQAAHDDRNLANMKTPAEKRANKLRKMFDDNGVQLALQVLVYSVGHANAFWVGVRTCSCCVQQDMPKSYANMLSMLAHDDVQRVGTDDVYYALPWFGLAMRFARGILT